MDRRDLLRALGAAAVLSVVPRNAEAAWVRLAQTPSGALRSLSVRDASLVGLLADTVIPRTDTPSATDVGVVAWVDLIVADYYTDDERRQFTDGLAAIDAARTTVAAAGGAGGAGSAGGATDSADTLGKLVEQLERGDRRSAESRAWWRLKGLVLHGYFTSERVQKEVLKVNIMPGKFDGGAPMAAVGGMKHD